MMKVLSICVDCHEFYTFNFRAHHVIDRVCTGATHANDFNTSESFDFAANFWHVSILLYGMNWRKNLTIPVFVRRTALKLRDSSGPSDTAMTTSPMVIVHSGPRAFSNFSRRRAPLPSALGIPPICPGIVLLPILAGRESCLRARFSRPGISEPAPVKIIPAGRSAER